MWYSEYIDRTAADYRDTILPAFRAEGVPLDVLVTDTDFKSPNTWSGWEIDTAKFPDPKEFFDWAESQVLHNTLNTLNTHPSLLDADAPGKVTAAGRRLPADAYVWDGTTRTLTVTLPEHGIRSPITLTY